MVSKIIAMVSSIRPSVSSLILADSVGTTHFGLSLSPLNLQRRLLFSHVGCAVPQSQIFGLKVSKLLSSERSIGWMPHIKNVVQASIIAAQETALEWVKRDNRRMLHAVYRVGI